MPLIIILTCIALFIALLLSAKVGLRIKYADGLKVYIKVLFITVQIYPFKARKKRYRHSMSKRKAQKIKSSLQKKPKKEKKKKQKKASHKKENEKKKSETQLSKDDILSVISIVLSFIKSFVGRFSGSVRLKASRIKIVVASDDAATTAITYGAVTQAINVLFPLLDKIKTVKRLPRGKELSVRADFTADTPSIELDIEIYVRAIKAAGSFLGAAITAFKNAVIDRMKVLERKKR